MEKAKPLPSVSCPIHQSQPIQKIDTRTHAQKHLYCLECILDSDDPKSLGKYLLSLGDFLRNASLFYLTHSHKITPSPGIPPEYAEVLASQNQIISNLATHIEKQKKVLDTIFKEITEVVLEQISQKKNLYVQVLEEQMLNARNSLSYFEKELRKSYPKQEDMEYLFPSKEKLEEKLSKIQESSQLAGFIKDIQNDMCQDDWSIFSSHDQTTKKKFLDDLIKSLNDNLSKQPAFESKDLDLSNLATDIGDNLDKFLTKTLILASPISRFFPFQNKLKSTIIRLEEFNQLQEWLPKISLSNINLLYRGSRDGMTADAFHSKCDEKGPTLTLIKCQFKGASNSSVIGGYLDQSWNQKNSYITSHEAFIFSLTTKKKCPVVSPEHAAKGMNNAFAFGHGYNLFIIFNDLKNSYVDPSNQYYKNTEDIVDFAKVNGQIFFSPQEIEVFALK